VWADLPPGRTTLTIQALDRAGRVLDPAHSRTFHRAAPFDGQYPPASLSWRESAELGLKSLVHSPDLRCWFATGEPEAQFHLYRYPYKIVSAAAVALAVYATQQPAPEDAAPALQAARRAADYLLGLCFPAEAAWAYHPPTYHPTLYRDRLKGHMAPENHMTTSGAEGGLHFLTLHRATGDLRYRAAAIRIAETYARHQRPDGSWPLFVRARDGALVTDNVMVPTMVVDFLDRLESHTGLTQFNAMRDRAVAWIEAHPVRTWNWQGQFEDVKPQPPYENLTKHDACDYALHLLRRPVIPATERELALEILRFAEDQFVIWAQPPAERPGKQSPDGVAGAKATR
jgi:maltose/maltodextrin transport system substrate-binding protein